MKKIFILLIMVFSFQLCAEVNIEDMADIAEIGNIYPRNDWRVVRSAEGDLNKDGIEDIVLVLQKIDTKNMIDASYQNGTDILDLNPRVLLIYFADKNGKYHKKIILSDFIENRDKADMPDPLNALYIDKKGVLNLVFNRWKSDIDLIFDHHYKFKFKKGRFVLIGYDAAQLRQSNGDLVSCSINFYTKKIKILKTNKLNNFRSERWETLNLKNSVTLKNIKEFSSMKINKFLLCN